VSEVDLGSGQHLGPSPDGQILGLFDCKQGREAISSGEGEGIPMLNSSSWVVVGLDNGGNCNSATVLDGLGRFLVDSLVESPSRVREGPEVAIEALAGALDHVLGITGVPRESVRSVGLGTPGPASPMVSSPQRGRRTSPKHPGGGSIFAPRSSVVSGFLSSTTTMATQQLFTRTIPISGATQRCTPRCRRSSARA